MSIEMLMRAADAAGFAMASDENSEPQPQAARDRPAVPALEAMPTPKQAVSRAFADAARTASAHWTRSHFTSLLGVWG